MAMIKRWRNELLTYLYVKYVFMPMLEDAMDEEDEWRRSKTGDIGRALVERGYNTLQ